VSFVIITLFLVPAAIFASLESDWNYIDSLYYCFISLTTIGLGDFIPGDTPGQSWRPLYKACTTCKIKRHFIICKNANNAAFFLPQFISCSA
jgi:hypothetical protein